MSRRYVISDTHFGHKGLLRRPDRAALFRDVFHMDSHMISQWNSVVTKRDTVFHLGDVTMHDKNYAEDLITKRLNGHIVVIGGNHDKNMPFVEYLYGAHSLKVHGFRIIMTHIPIHPQEFYRWEYNLHGHLHEKFVWKDWSIGEDGSVRGTQKDPRYINCSAENVSYTPTDIEIMVPKK